MRRRTFVNGNTFYFTDVEIGVPQGSVLGPQLFTIYSAPIADLCRNHDLIVEMYADDTQLLLFFDVKSSGTEFDIKGRM